jgi:hypothetical protein
MSSVVYYPGYSQVQVQQNLRCQTITAITNANPCVVTTAANHNFVAGMMVSFLIPAMYGMPQINAQTAQVLSITNNTLTVKIDTTSYGVFAYPSPLPRSYAFPSVIPVSSGPYLPPTPLPYSNQDSFEGVIYNDGTPGNPI